LGAEHYPRLLGLDAALSSSTAPQSP